MHCLIRGSNPYLLMGNAGASTLSAGPIARPRVHIITEVCLTPLSHRTFFLEITATKLRYRPSLVGTQCVIRSQQHLAAAGTSEAIPNIEPLKEFNLLERTMSLGCGVERIRFDCRSRHANLLLGKAKGNAKGT